MTDKSAFMGVHGLFGTGWAFLARHASEQYFTSAQFLAQLLRQVISRPHATQGLLGSADLFPLKPITPTPVN